MVKKVWRKGPTDFDRRIMGLKESIWLEFIVGECLFTKNNTE